LQTARSSHLVRQVLHVQMQFTTPA
jgi:hypothetical protein